MRKQTYEGWIKQAMIRLRMMQDIREYSPVAGSFYYPYWRDETTNFVNARWQEGVLTFAWYYKKYGTKDLDERIVKGIDNWCKLQHNDGSFPEHSKKDKSFAATAFSTFAVLQTIKLLDYKQDEWMTAIQKACDWLIKNDETVLINQQAAAALTLLTFGKYINDYKYIQAADKKLRMVLAHQHEQGYYKEKGNFDLGYSSLTLELLGMYYLATQDEEILRSVSTFIEFVAQTDLTQLKNIRNSNWIIIHGFEIFADKTAQGKEALQKMLNTFNVHHLEYEDNLCTDLYRLCLAHDHATANVEHKALEPTLHLQDGKREQCTSPKALNILRPFGLHKLRKWKASQ